MYYLQTGGNHAVANDGGACEYELANCGSGDVRQISYYRQLRYHLYILGRAIPHRD